MRISDWSSDVCSSDLALIGMARLLKQTQPRLWEHAARLRNKRHVATLLDTIAITPVLHVSRRSPAARLCAAAVLPLAPPPRLDSRGIGPDRHRDPVALPPLDP